MKGARRLAMLGLALLFVAGCATTGHFRVPDGSKLYVYKRPNPVQVGPGGEVTTKPFIWTAMGMPPNGGIPYRLVKHGKVVKKGRLRANFRVVSIFWPPAALLYWPVGFNPSITYDLVTGKQQ